MLLEKIEEYAINPPTHQAIQNLLQKSFELYPKDRIFYKQVPSFRLLVWEETTLIAQIGVIFRVVSLDEQPFRIFGLMDLCVDNEYQNRQIATKILEKIETIGKENNIDFILLFSSIQDFYAQKGFRIVENNCRWVLIKDYKTMGILNRQIPETLLIKPISNKKWNDNANLDLMGFVF